MSGIRIVLRLLYERRERAWGEVGGREQRKEQKKKVVGSGVFFAKMSFSLRRESHLASAIEQEYNKLIQF